MHRPELLRYHPNRLIASRDYFRPLYNHYRNLVPPDGIMSDTEYRDLFSRFMRGYWIPRLTEVRVEERPRNSKRQGDEFDLFCQVARFYLSGRNIFHFSPSLANLLRFTDVDDVLWSSIKVPYQSFYVYFGVQEQCPLGDLQHLVDGTYLSEILSPEFRGVGVTLTTCSEVGEDEPSWNYILREDRYYYFPFEIHSPGETVGETLRRTVGADAVFNAAWAPPEIPAEAEQMANERGISLDSLPVEATAQGQTVRENLERLPVFGEALRLVVNCLCYLSSPSREVTARYPDSDITRAITRVGTALERARAEKRAVREGYTLIHFCGDSLEREGESVPTGRELPAHWRRGHWRHQAVGPSRSEHKLIWIRPTLVRKDKADLGVPGHVYDMDRPT
jgi:hypothetical protein